jgi:hypothetical protein
MVPSASRATVRTKSPRQDNARRLSMPADTSLDSPRVTYSGMQVDRPHWGRTVKLSVRHCASRAATRWRQRPRNSGDSKSPNSSALRSLAARASVRAGLDQQRDRPRSPVSLRRFRSRRAARRRSGRRPSPRASAGAQPAEPTSDGDWSGARSLSDLILVARLSDVRRVAQQRQAHIRWQERAAPLPQTWRSVTTKPACFMSCRATALGWWACS